MVLEDYQELRKTPYYMEARRRLSFEDHESVQRVAEYGRASLGNPDSLRKLSSEGREHLSQLVRAYELAVRDYSVSREQNQTWSG